MLRVDSVSSGYKRIQIINDVSIEARPGEVTVIVGPNGSGKSTLLKTIAGLTTMYSGTIDLDGKTLSHLRPHEVARAGLAYLPQNDSSFVQLKVKENLRMAGYTIHKEELRQRIDEALEMFPQLSNYMDQKVQNLSGGERQMVAMSMALIRKPKVLMFDEPSANLSPKLATAVLSAVRSLATDRGLTVILVEQNAKKALEMGTKAYLLVSGKKVFDGSAKELLDHKELAQMYLGVKTAAAAQG